MHIPDQRVRDALLNLIVFQGDTEFASVEQQRSLLEKAPSDFGSQSIVGFSPPLAERKYDRL